MTILLLSGYAYQIQAHNLLALWSEGGSYPLFFWLPYLHIYNSNAPLAYEEYIKQCLQISEQNACYILGVEKVWVFSPYPSPANITLIR